ncbi:hypothetical protein [Massilia sp. H6]|uniref:hypothetical protein n=1 Tax=Massilia sp. H6 TaxID=2970464 RepID=UPI002169DCAE|nr:hypothetical protein [Massilia sp. H6]UVW28044.1 hypothetical protein NRS07_16105 [Massilia sp. H6]
MTTVDVNELEDAVLLVSDPEHGARAWVGLDTGSVYVRAGGIDPDAQPLPENIATSDRYTRVPGSCSLDLGQVVVFDFVQAEMPEQYDHVRRMFERQAAYRHFGKLVDERGLRERWHAFRDQRTVAALRGWCEANGLQLSVR